MIISCCLNDDGVFEEARNNASLNGVKLVLDVFFIAAFFMISMSSVIFLSAWVFELTVETRSLLRPFLPFLTTVRDLRCTAKGNEVEI